MRCKHIVHNWVILSILISGLIFAGCASNTASKQKDPPASDASSYDEELSLPPLAETEKIPETPGGVSQQSKMITDIRASGDAGAVNVWIEGNQLLTYTSVKQTSPLAIILYFSETALDIDDIRLPENDIIESVKAKELIENGYTSRVELLLRSDSFHEISREGTGVKISFGKAAGDSESARSEKAGEQFPEIVSEAKKSPKLEFWNPDLNAWVSESGPVKAEPQPHDYPAATRVESVYAKQFQDGLKVFVGADGAINNYKAFTIESPARIVFDIFNIRSPYKSEKRVPVDSEWVRRVRYYAYPDRLRVVLDTKKPYLSAFSAHPVQGGLEILVGNLRAEAGASEPSLTSATQVRSIYATRQDNGIIINVRGNGSITAYKTSTTDSPPTIVFDISGIKEVYEDEIAFPVDTQWVKKVRYSSDAGKLRVFIDTQKAYLSDFSSYSDKDGLVIRVGGTKGGGQQAEPSVLPAGSKAAWVDLVVLAPQDAGRSTLILETSQPVKYDIKEITDKKLQLRLFNTQISDSRYKRGSLMPQNFESAVDQVTPVSPSSGWGDSALFDIDLREAVPYFVEQSDEGSEHFLMVHFEASSIPPPPEDRSEPAAPREVAGKELRVSGPADKQRADVSGDIAAARPVTPPETSVPRDIQPPETYQAPVPAPTPPDTHMAARTGVPDPLSPAPFNLQTGSPPPVQISGQFDADMGLDQNPAAEAQEDIQLPDEMREYSGEKIALDFFDTDIKNVFRILREVSSKNFAIDSNVAGKVTLTLEHPVPWDQVLDLILKMNQLGKTMEGDIIRVATLETLRNEDKFRDDEEIERKSRLEKQKALEPVVTEYIAVSYSSAKNEILPHIKEILTKDRGHASVDDRTNILIITDTAEKIKQTKEIVSKLDRVTPQVVIEARIVEANTSFSRDIGTKWGAGGGIQNKDTNAGIGPQRGYDIFGGTYGWDMAMNLPAAVANPASIGLNFMRIAGTPFQLDAQLQAMESRGEGKVISAPKIVTLDNKLAKIKQGVSYPYQVVEDGDVSIKFKDVDLLLEVKPHVTPDNRISMEINITKNELGQLYGGERAYTNKEAKTELLVNDGDTVVIGGIIKTIESDDLRGLPGLSKIPLLGWLFKSKHKEKQKEELLIFITPRILQLEQRITQY